MAIASAGCQPEVDEPNTDALDAGTDLVIEPDADAAPDADVVPDGEPDIPTELGEGVIAIQTQPIDEDGGLLTFGDVPISIDIPAGALDREVTIEVIVEEADFPGAAGPTYALGPPGLTFSEPVTVTIEQDLALLDEVADPGDTSLSERSGDRWYRVFDYSIDPETYAVSFDTYAFQPTQIQEEGTQEKSNLDFSYNIYSLSTPIYLDPDGNDLQLTAGQHCRNDGDCYGSSNAFCNSDNVCELASSCSVDLPSHADIAVLESHPYRTCPTDPATPCDRLCCTRNSACKSFEEALHYVDELWWAPPRNIVFLNDMTVVSGQPGSAGSTVGGTSFPIYLRHDVGVVGPATFRAPPGEAVFVHDWNTGVSVLEDLTLISEPDPILRRPTGAALEVWSGTVIGKTLTSNRTSTGVYAGRGAMDASGVQQGGTVHLIGGLLAGHAAHVELTTTGTGVRTLRPGRIEPVDLADHHRDGNTCLNEDENGNVILQLCSVIDGTVLRAAETFYCDDDDFRCRSSVYIESPGDGQTFGRIVRPSLLKDSPEGIGIWYNCREPSRGNSVETLWAYPEQIVGVRDGVWLGYLASTDGLRVADRDGLDPEGSLGRANCHAHIEGLIKPVSGSGLVIASDGHIDRSGLLHRESTTEDTVLDVFKGPGAWFIPIDVAMPFEEWGEERWWELKEGNEPPTRRFGAVGCYDGTNAVLFGGQFEGTPLSDTHLFEWDSYHWFPYSLDLEPPEPRAFSAMASAPDRDRCFLFGGRGADTGGEFNYPLQAPQDTGLVWEWDRFAGWYERRPAPDPYTGRYPAARHGHSFTRVGDTAYLLAGGWNGRTEFEDTWIYIDDGEDGSWHELSDTTVYSEYALGNAPYLRHDHGSASFWPDDDRTAVLDGNGGLSVFNWHSCLLLRTTVLGGSPCVGQTAGWVEQTGDGDSPPALLHAGLARIHDTSAGNPQILLFGGEDYTEGIGADFFTYIPSWTYGTGTWTDNEVQEDTSLPQARRAHTMIQIDTTDQPEGDLKVLVFGGQSADTAGNVDETLGDTWLYMRGYDQATW